MVRGGPGGPAAVAADRTRAQYAGPVRARRRAPHADDQTLLTAAQAALKALRAAPAGANTSPVHAFRLDVLLRRLSSGGGRAQGLPGNSSSAVGADDDDDDDDGSPSAVAADAGLAAVVNAIEVGRAGRRNRGRSAASGSREGDTKDGRQEREPCNNTGRTQGSVCPGGDRSGDRGRGGRGPCAGVAGGTHHLRAVSGLSATVPPRSMPSRPGDELTARLPIAWGVLGAPLDRTLASPFRAGLPARTHTRRASGAAASTLSWRPGRWTPPKCASCSSGLHPRTRRSKVDAGSCMGDRDIRTGPSGTLTQTM